MATIHNIHKIALLSVHTSPLARLGGKKTGGMNVYVRELARELGRRGIEVDIYTRRSDPDMPTVDCALGANVRVIHIKAGPACVLEPDAVYPHLSEFVAGILAFTTTNPTRYDLIYSHYWLSGWVANTLKEVWNIPFVHMFHTLGHMKHRIGSNTVPMPTVRIATETKIVAWADRLIAATGAEEAELRWLYRAERRKIDIVPPGVDTAKFKPIPTEEACKRLGIDPDSNLMLFVGRIERLKAVDMILEAIALIRQANGDLINRLCFAIIGGNPNDPADTELVRLQNLARDLDLGETVAFLGAKDHSLLPLYYAAAKAVIVPSDYESFGMVALEAMASGTPVIASEVGGLAFLVRDQETGFLVPARDPDALAQGMRQLLTDPDRREEMGRNAAELAKEYNWSHITDQLLRIFDDLVARRRTCPCGR